MVVIDVLGAGLQFKLGGANQALYLSDPSPPFTQATASVLIRLMAWPLLNSRLFLCCFLLTYGFKRNSLVCMTNITQRLCFIPIPLAVCQFACLAQREFENIGMAVV